ncbi:transposase-like Mu [Paramagnetospirillum caucaseum]|uniref:Transposase-like Mu n=2 Tax=Paramagnetospirillum caucaseum TaxID=1244869 RepID=M2Y9Q0_9PROT|nr:transposase-like Mu [Paramagnetospirillum caucaseum]
MTAAELAGLGLPKFPASPQGVNKRAGTEGWPRRRRADATHAWEYRVAAILPALDDAAREILRHGHAHHVAASLLPAPVVAAAATSLAPVELIGDTTHLTNSQRAIMDARAAILAYVDRLIPVAGGITQARQQVERLAKGGNLPPEIARLLPVANAKAGTAGSRTICLRTLINWHTERTAAGGKAVALAPKVPEPDMSVPAWAPALLSLYNTPTKRSLRDIVENDLAKPGALPMGIAPPSYGQARRWLDKVSTIERNRGRLGPKELKSLQPYVRRDLSGLDPLDIVQSDGHCLDAEVTHPRHGRPFRPEMTTIIDLATRLCVGWSAGLAENALGVTEAIVYMVTRWCIPAVWYVDNGSGYNNQLMDDGRTGLLARIRTTKLNRLPNNPQAGGYVERSHQSIWIKGARRLPTYMGRDMDRQAGQKVHKITRADIKAFGASRHLMAWNEYLAWAEAMVTEYNNTPHRGLPKITDPVTGRRRHQTPMEAWTAAIQRGWNPLRVSQAEAADLTRPYETRKVLRGTVSVLGSSYFNRDLKDWHDCEVLVGYDVHDASKVYVRDLDGRLICEAGFEANKRSVVPRSYLDAALDRRHQGRIQRAEAHVAEIHAERGHQMIDVTATPVLPDNVAAIHQHLVLEMTATQIPAATIAAIPETAAGRFQRWRDLDAATATGTPVSDDERRWHQRYPLSAEWRAQTEMAASFDREEVNADRAG